jgi:hypothetical protein
VNLDQAQLLLSKLPVKDRESGLIVKFVFNANQQTFMSKLKTQYDSIGMVRAIVLKARRVGICLDPATKVLTKDLKWVRIDSLQAGDELVGVDEYPKKGRGNARKMRVAVVASRNSIVSPVLRFVFDNGISITATPEHRFLCHVRTNGHYGHRGREVDWLPASRLRVGDKIRRITDVWGEPSYEDGWFGGLLDGEGSIRPKSRAGCELCCSQNEGSVLIRARNYLTTRGFTFHADIRNRQQKDGHKRKPNHKLVVERIDEILRLIGSTRPSRFLSTWWEGKELPGKKSGNAYRTIISIEPLPQRHMVDIETSTGTFIAEGLVSHNSSASDGLLVPHCLSRPQAHAKIVAHRADTAEGLFRVPRDLARALPFPVGEIMTRKIIFHHPQGNSVMDIATAGAVSGGRGLTLSGLHLSEAAQFTGEDSFLSLLPAVQNGPGSMVFIESTAFGRVGVGKAFYEFWTNSVKGKTGYVPIFLPWLDDPACVRSAREATDAPANDIERTLMARPFYATKNQIAWFRHTLESQCQGLMPKMMQEYPHTPEVAFVASGDPAFTEEEIAYVRETVRPPAKIGHLELNDGRPQFITSRRGSLLLWEPPQHGHRYYIGADAATGIEDGDFAAYVILDGTTGKLTARFAERVHPENLAEQLWMAGLLYNNAKINIELTGHLGRVIQRILRDDYRYWNLYGDKRKDDALPRPGGTQPRSGGWETNTNTRRLLFDTFRTCLRAGIRGEEGGVEIFDEAVIDQMDLATLTEGMNWEVERGHDDILFSTMLACITCVQYPPPRIRGRSRRPDPEETDPASRMPMLVKNELPISLGDHLRELERTMKRAGRPHPLEGI